MREFQTQPNTNPKIRYLPYAGIGSRETPARIQNLMNRIAYTFEKEGFILRSGGADGADSAFENGVVNNYNKEIYLPWNGFNGRYGVSNNPDGGLYTGYPTNEIAEEAYEYAKKFHPAWDRCSRGAKLMHARNVSQILGWSLLEPSKFVVCWTPNGNLIGGTAQALRLANYFEVPVFNLGLPTDMESMTQMLDELKAFAKHIKDTEGEVK